MNRIIAALGRFLVIGTTAFGIAAIASVGSHKGYWQGTIRAVQTVDFNILSNTLPTKLSYALLKNNSEELQRTINSNYGLFGIIVTDCNRVIWECPNQKILYMTKSRRSWKDFAQVDRLRYHPFDLLRDPPPLIAERGYDGAHDTSWATIGTKNKGNVIGRVYYIRGIPPSFRQDYIRWLSNPISMSGAHKYYALTAALFVTGGIAAWLFIEFLYFRKKQKEDQAEQERQQLQQTIDRTQGQLREQLEYGSRLISDKEQLATQLEQYEREQEGQVRLLHQTIAQMEQQSLSAQVVEKSQAKTQEDIQQREEAIAALQAQIAIYKQSTQSVEALNQQLVELNEQLHSAQVEQESSTAQIIEEARASFYADIQQREGAITALQTQIATYEQSTQSVEALNQQLVELNEQLHSAQVEQESSTAQIIEETRASFYADIQQREEAITALQTQIAAYEQSTQPIKVLNQQLLEQEEQVKRLNETIIFQRDQQALSAQVGEETQTKLQADIRRREEAIATLQCQIAAYEKNSDQSVQSIETLRQDLAEAVQNVQHMNQEMNDLHKKFELKEQERQQGMKQLLQRLRDEAEEAKRREAQAHSDREEVERSLSEIRQQKAELELQLSDAENEDLNKFEKIILDNLRTNNKSRSGQWISLPQMDVKRGRLTRQFVDCLLVSESCVVVIEAKNYSGKIKAIGDPKSTLWQSHKLNGECVKIACGCKINPYKQVSSYTDSVMSRLSREVDRNLVKVYSMVIFPDNADVSAISAEIGGYCRVIPLKDLTPAIKEIEAIVSSRINNDQSRRSPQQISNLLHGLPAS